MILFSGIIIRVSSGLPHKIHGIYEKQIEEVYVHQEEEYSFLVIHFIEDQGTHHNSKQYDDKNMLGDIGNVFVKCMRQVTKGHLYHPSGVSDYYVMYRQRPQSVLQLGD